jgi:uncharacterized repeat protein (TIGR01451 family)
MSLRRALARLALLPLAVAAAAWASPAAAQISIEHVTITGNSATVDTGGALFLFGSDGGIDVVLENTLIAGNTAPDGPDCSRDEELGVGPQGVNLLGIGDGGAFGEDCLTGPPNLVGTLATPIDPLLGPLADNGGETPTHALQQGSPALDAAPDQGETEDQRTVARPQGAAFDVGAFEAEVADLALAKTDSADPVPRGGAFTYTVEVENLGPGAAVDVTLVDTLPAELTFQSAAPSAGGSCVTPAVGSSGGVVSCTFAGPVGVGETVSVTIGVGVPADAVPGSVVVNQAAAASAGGDPDPDPTPNEVEEETRIAAAALSLTKTDSADPVEPGATFTYTVTVENLGPDPATDVVVADMLPAELTFQSATPSAGGLCVTPAVGSMGGTVTCTFAGATGVGELRSIDVVVGVPTGATPGSVVNEASATSATDDSAPAATSESTLITGPSVLEIPTLGELGLLLLALALAAGGLRALPTSTRSSRTRSSRDGGDAARPGRGAQPTGWSSR